MHKIEMGVRTLSKWKRNAQNKLYNFNHYVKIGMANHLILFITLEDAIYIFIVKKVLGF